MSLKTSNEKLFCEGIQFVSDPFLRKKLEHLFQVTTKARDKKPKKTISFTTFIERSQPSEKPEEGN